LGNKPNRRSFLKTAAGAACAGVLSRAQSTLPNIVFILADDMGFGDVGCYGSNIPTPNLDQMAADGIRLDHFYAASAVCSPSRAALLTGRYPPRVGVPNVLIPTDQSGLSLTETILPQVLKPLNYSTMCIGKWHLGTNPGYMPADRGFDDFYGVPYSNDQAPLPLISSGQVIEQPATQQTLTQRFTQRAVSFINNAGSRPFFLYLAYTAPHVPLAPNPNFAGKSGAGRYGDIVMELDWGVGQVLAALKANGLDANTLVMFTSDNGPWYQGSPGKLRGRKGEIYEGGLREPFIARWPGRIPSGQISSAFATMMDVFPTVAGLTGAGLPAAMDGVDIFPLLSGQQKMVPHDTFFYFDGWNLQAARVANMKLHVARYNIPPWLPSSAGIRVNLPLLQPELYDVIADPQESTDISTDHPDVVASIRARILEAIPNFPWQVHDSWAATMNQVVTATWDGALPSQ
jgi:arylsulfatase A-like enzyme